MRTHANEPLPQGTVVEYFSGNYLFQGIVISTPIIYHCQREYIVADLEVEGTVPDRCYVLREADEANLRGNPYLLPVIRTVRSASITKVIGRMGAIDLQGILAWLSIILAISSEYSHLQTYEYMPGTVVLVDHQYLDNTGSKIRPMVIISQVPIAQTFNTLISLYITSQIMKATCDTDWILYDWQSAGLKKQSAVRCRFDTFPISKCQHILGRLSPYDFAEVQRSLRRAFGLGED